MDGNKHLQNVSYSMVFWCKQSSHVGSLLFGKEKALSTVQHLFEATAIA